MNSSLLAPLKREVYKIVDPVSLNIRFRNFAPKKIKIKDPKEYPTNEQMIEEENASCRVE